MIIVVLTAVYALTHARPQRAVLARYLGLLAGTIVGCFVLGCAMLPSISVAQMFTALSGNPPVNSSDTDLIGSLTGIVPGLVLGVLARMTHNYGLDNAAAPTPHPPIPTPEPVDT